MQLIKPKEGQNEALFLKAVMATGCTVTFLTGGIYSVPEKVINTLNHQNIGYVSVPKPVDYKIK